MKTPRSDNTDRGVSSFMKWESALVLARHELARMLQIALPRRRLFAFHQPPCSGQPTNQPKRRIGLQLGAPLLTGFDGRTRIFESLQSLIARLRRRSGN